MRAPRRLMAGAIAVAVALGPGGCARDPDPDVIAVGLLTPAGPVRDAVLLAIEQVNASGGVLGRRVRPVDAPASAGRAAGASRLIDVDRVSAVFGCADQDRAALRPLFAGGRVPLICPYGGGEPEPYELYTGPAANQRLVPALEYLAARGRTAIYVIGGPDSGAAAAIVRAYAATGAVSVAGEERLAAGSPRLPQVVAAIAGSRATAVLNLLGGVDGARFFAAYAGAGLTPGRLPVLTVSPGGGDVEADADKVPAARLAGQLFAASYLRSMPGPANEAFVRAWSHRYGPRPTGEPTESAFVGVHVWRAMVAKAGSFDLDRIVASGDGIVFNAPEGRVGVDAPRRHLYKTARIGRAEPDGVIREVWNSGAPLRPDPRLRAYPWARGLAR